MYSWYEYFCNGKTSEGAGYQFYDLFYSKLISLKFKAAVLKSSTGFINEYSFFWALKYST